MPEAAIQMIWKTVRLTPHRLRCARHNRWFNSQLRHTSSLSDTNVLFYFQVYREGRAVEESLRRLRRAFPTAPVFLISDHGLDYGKIAEQYNCHYEFSRENIGVHGDNWLWQAYLERIRRATAQFPREFMVLMEPDVLINGIPLHPMRGDCNSVHNIYNTFSREFSAFICAQNGWPQLTLGYSCGGGAVFRSSALLGSINQASVHDVERMAGLDERISLHNDALFAALILLSSFSIFFHGEIANYDQLSRYLPFVHDYKRDY